MNYIVYQAYGKLDILNECIYSLYSLEKYIGDAEVVIYTDNESYISRLAPMGLKINYQALSPDRIASWQGDLKFVHRLKIKMLAAFVEGLEREEVNILYMDTDTKITKDLKPVFERIANGDFCMHVEEGNIMAAKSPYAKLKKAMKKDVKLQDLISVNQSMWNAGVLGFKSMAKTRLAEVLELSDKIYAQVKIHSAEQLAFSLKFGQEGQTLFACDNFIFHYWNFKEYRGLLNDFFSVNKTEEEIKSEIDKIDVIELIKPKRYYESLPRYKQELRKLVGRWKMPTYQK